MPSRILKIERLVQELNDTSKQDYEVVIPLDREGDIDEIDYYGVVGVTWDIAEKRVILEW